MDKDPHYREEEVMTRSIALFPALGAALLTLAAGARAGDLVDGHAIKAHVPQTAAARKWADLIARTERALGGYAAACAAGEGRALSQVTTDDLHVEYTLGEPGTYLTVDGANAPAGCAAMSGLVSRTSNVWIFPTNSAVVFVQFDGPAAAGAPSQRQLALVEMRGERIARIVNFSATPPVAPTTLVAAE
jgi:hypothetical protein